MFSRHDLDSRRLIHSICGRHHPLCLCFHVPCWNHKDIIIDLCRSLQFHLDHSASSFPRCTSHSRFLITTTSFDSTSPFIYARRRCRQPSAIVEAKELLWMRVNSFALAMILSRHLHILGSEAHGFPAFSRTSDLWSVQDPISLSIVLEWETGSLHYLALSDTSFFVHGWWCLWWC